MTGTSTFPRIAFFAASMKPGLDGVTRVLYKTSEKLIARRIQHIFFSATVPHRWEQSVAMYKVPSVPVPFYPQYRLSLLADLQVNAVLARYSPDILCVNSPCSLGWAAIYYANAKKIPLVAYYHTHFVSYAQYYKVDVLTDLGWHYMRMFYKNAQKTFVPSQPIMEELSAHGIPNLSLLPHGVDTDLFTPERSSTAWKRELHLEGRPVLLYVGRLVWEKDLATLAAAWTIIRRKVPHAALVLVGDGPIRRDLEQLLPDAVFLGYREGEALAVCYASADLFVFPSTTETFGMVTLEAMASGTPPVCADAGGAAGIIQHGVTGYLARPRDAADFAGRCIELLDDPSGRQRIGAKAHVYARSQSWDAVVDRMLDEYRAVIEGYAPREKRKKRKAVKHESRPKGES